MTVSEAGAAGMSVSRAAKGMLGSVANGSGVDLLRDSNGGSGTCAGDAGGESGGELG